MRVAIAALFSLFVAPGVGPAKADPYRWCAQYGGFGGGGVESCYYLTLEQCRASVSGIGGWCRESGWYDGRPVSTDVPPPRPRKRG
ncbi:MAG: hypothetical protein QOF91_1172 [Alphaproteobacteria bacterium]|jgi:hypothetical protein|nr:hypothetical protein [Alphaproteobacteria bacterium]